jgi:hypothetical protein
MSGHSKWANKPHNKPKEHAKRAKAFTRHIREITVAAREGGGEPGGNPVSSFSRRRSGRHVPSVRAYVHASCSARTLMIGRI